MDQGPPSDAMLSIPSTTANCHIIFHGDSKSEALLSTDGGVKLTCVSPLRKLAQFALTHRMCHLPYFVVCIPWFLMCFGFLFSAYIAIYNANKILQDAEYDAASRLNSLAYFVFVLCLLFVSSSLTKERPITTDRQHKRNIIRL